MAVVAEHIRIMAISGIKLRLVFPEEGQERELIWLLRDLRLKLMDLMDLEEVVEVVQ